MSLGVSYQAQFSPELERSLVRLETEPALDPTDFRIELRDPKKVVQELGDAFAFFEATEGGVDQFYAPKIQNLRPDHPVLGRSTPVWARHEAAHNQIWDGLNRSLDITPLAPQDDSDHIRGHGIVSFLMNILPNSGPLIVDWVTTTIAEANEFMTGKGYQRLMTLTKNIEPDLSVIFRTIGKQEALHLNFYHVFRLWIESIMRQEHDPNKTPWELRLARKIFAVGQTVVGTSEFGKEATAAMLKQLTAGEAEEFVKRVQEKAREILGNRHDRRMTKFVMDSLK